MNSFVLGGGSTKVARLELLVPPSGGTHELSFWAHALSGEVEFRVTTADDRLLASWVGQSGETDLTLVLPVGRNRVEIDGSHADSLRTPWCQRTCTAHMSTRPSTYLN